MAIWQDMSYNQLEPDFLNRLEPEPEENDEEEVLDEPNQTNSLIFNRYERVL